MNLHPIIANRKSARGLLHGHITSGIRKFEMGTVGMEEPTDRLSCGVFQNEARDQLKHIERRLFELHDDIDFRSIRGEDAGRLDGPDHMIAGPSRIDFGSPRHHNFIKQACRAFLAHRVNERDNGRSFCRIASKDRVHQAQRYDADEQPA